MGLGPYRIDRWEPGALLTARAFDGYVFGRPKIDRLEFSTKGELIGTNFDPVGDSQAGAADTDLVGDTTHAAMYVAFDNGGTLGTADDDYMLFRIRVDNPTSSTHPTAPSSR